MAVKFPGPVKNSVKQRGAREWFSNLPIGADLVDVHIHMDDFDQQALDETNNWTIVKDAGASVALSADALKGSVLLSSTATTDDDGSSIQSSNEVWALTANKKSWFECKFQVSDADQMDVFVGICENFATNPEACLTSSNRIGFQIDDGNASILCKSEKTNTETSTDSGVDAADATDVIVGWHWDGNASMKFFVDRALVATHTADRPLVNMTAALFELSGNNSGTKTMTVDYIFLAQER